ncbi:hypothetical protein QR680_013630 [Steinernema hermaphroditum]|uniref:BTB domain-containing protein n=1 Tax=Steinernema hermaphroditum TaxID=289476 RepID=A0AA39M2L3_9BILA|nr:hypothetical protein QR680_013630 [Steinernema hermaphroditum]
MLPELRSSKSVAVFSLQINETQLADGKKMNSESQTLQGIDWRLQCFYHKDQNAMEVALVMAKPLADFYMMEMSHSLVLDGGQGKTVLVEEKQPEVMSLSNSIAVGHVELPEETFNGNGNLTLEYSIRVYRMKKIDFQNSSKIADATVSLDDGAILHLSKAVLSIHSPVLERLLVSPCFEEKPFVALPGIQMAPLLVVLYHVYGMEIRLDSKSLSPKRLIHTLDLPTELLRVSMEVAHRLQIAVSLRRFEVFLEALPAAERILYFDVADRFEMVAVVHRIIEDSGKEEIRRLFEQFDDSISYNSMHMMLHHLIEIL